MKITPILFLPWLFTTNVYMETLLMTILYPTPSYYTHNHHAHATTEPFSIGIIQPKPFTTNATRETQDNNQTKHVWAYHTQII